MELPYIFTPHLTKEGPIEPQKSLVRRCSEETPHNNKVLRR